MSPPQRRPGLDAELLDQQAARLLERLQRVGLAARPVQRDHLLAAQTLAQRVLGDQPVELRDHETVPPERQVGVDTVLHGCQAPLVQARGLIDESGLVGEIAERGSAPQRQRLVQLVRGPVGLAGGERGTTLVGERFEPGGVQAVVGHDQSVAARLGDEMTVAERLAQGRYVVVQAPGRGRRRRLAPQCVDQPLGGHRLVGVHEQHGEQQPPAPVRDLDASGAVVDNLQLSEDAVANRFRCRDRTSGRSAS